MLRVEAERHLDAESAIEPHDLALDRPHVLVDFASVVVARFRPRGARARPAVIGVESKGEGDAPRSGPAEDGDRVTVVSRGSTVWNT